MNEEICSITYWGKTAENEWEDDDSEFLWVVYQKSRQFFFHN